LSNTYHLVVLETRHIQSYIFNSNRLKENVGASYLVKVATQDWIYAEFGSIDDQPPIENGKTPVEIIYCGGGKAVLLFRHKEDATEFIRTHSRQILREARGLQFTFHRQEFIWGKEPLSYAVADALGSLKLARNKQPLRTGIAGLGVTAMCASTSLPATHINLVNDRWQAVSSEIHAKRESAKPANDKLRDNLITKTDYTFPLDLDKLGGTLGASNFIAIIHADGNGLGQIIQNTKQDFPDTDGKKGNRAYIAYLRDFSEKIKLVATESLKRVVTQLIDSIEIDKDGKRWIRGKGQQPPIEITHDDQLGAYPLPLRPLVSGGDDVTFVCDGRIGLDMMILFLESFEQQAQKLLDKPLTACAGMAIVNTKYPFSRAYDLAGELCDNAKKEYHGKGKSAFDWHYTTGGLYDDITGMREREYLVGGRKLFNRPISISDNPAEEKTSAHLKTTITYFQTNLAWRKSRNKLKKLVDAIRAGDKALQDFKTNYDSLLVPPNTSDSTLYDVLELVDLYIALKGGKTDVSAD